MTDRRDFIRTTGILCAAGVLGVLELSSCKTLYSVTAITVGKNTLSVPLSDLKENTKGDVKYRNFVLVQNNTLNYSIALYLQKDGNYTALKMICTHKACELNATPTQLVCPCHGSEFDTAGKRLSGPASTDLITFPIERSNENLLIHL